MKRSPLLFIALGLSLMGAGCFASPASPTPTPTATSVTLTTAKGEINRIHVTMPTVGSKIARPLKIAGEARGWYFEGSFPVSVLNQNGVKIATGIAQATGDWMTDAWVPFTGTIDYPAQPAGSKGTIVFSKDNPSGLPEHDDSAEMQITF